MLATIDDLVESQALCNLYVWSDEPYKNSNAWIHSRSDHYAIVSVFDNDGSYEGIRCVRLEDIHRVDFDTNKNKFLEAIPTLERGIAAKISTPYQNCQDFIEFGRVLAKSKEPCEIWSDEMIAICGRVIAVDEWTAVIEHIDSDSLRFDGKTMIDLETVRYLWAHTKKIRGIPK